MSQYPKISIITPSYNQGGYIEQTIRSVLDQNYPNLEYIIIDGGSTDNTVDILKKYSDKLHYWVSEADKGQSDAINKGFVKATGEIVNWLNSDDYYAPGTFTNLAGAFADPQVQAVTTTVHNFEEGGAAWNERTGDCVNSVDFIARAFNNQPGTFFRKAVWDRYFPLPAQLHYTMDQYLWFCFWLEHNKDSWRNEAFTTAHFRRHAASKTQQSAADVLFHYLGKTFFNEHNLLFWSFFAERDEQKAAVIASYFWDDFPYRNRKITFPAALRYDPAIAGELFDRYLFELLKEDFRLGYFERLKTNLAALGTDHLSAEQRKALQKMKWASANQTAYKAYRKVYWKLKNFTQP